MSVSQAQNCKQLIFHAVYTRSFQAKSWISYSFDIEKIRIWKFLDGIVGLGGKIPKYVVQVFIYWSSYYTCTWYFSFLFYPKFLSEVQQWHTEVSNQDCHFFIDDVENHNDYKADEWSSYWSGCLRSQVLEDRLRSTNVLWQHCRKHQENREPVDNDSNNWSNNQKNLPRKHKKDVNVEPFASGRSEFETLFTIGKRKPIVCLSFHRKRMIK